MVIVKIVSQSRLTNTHVKKDKRGTKAKGNLVPYWEGKRCIYMLCCPNTGTLKWTGIVDT